MGAVLNTSDPSSEEKLANIGPILNQDKNIGPIFDQY
jgi:hypothetical protein